MRPIFEIEFYLQPRLLHSWMLNQTSQTSASQRQIHSHLLETKSLMSLLSPGFLLVCLFCFALLFSHPCPVYQEILLGIPSKYIQANLTLFNYSHCQPFPFPVANLRLLSDYYNILFTVLPCFILIPSVYFKPSRKTELVRCKSQTTSTPSSGTPSP